MERKIVVVAIAAVAALAGGYFVYSTLNRPPYALEVDATKDTTDISGTLYRIRVTNVGTEEITNIVVDMGGSDVQTKDSLKAGQSYYFYPEPETQTTTVRVTADQGIDIVTDYRTPIKVLGLPGAGR